MSSASESHFFTIVQGDKFSEVPRTLIEPVPQALGVFDLFGLWGNLGVSLLGFTGAIFVLQPNGDGTPELSLIAALAAVLIGTLLGTTAVALVSVAGARTGAPTMVLLRGLFGAQVSYVPTILNIVQCLGWGIFELVTISTAAHTIAPSMPRWAYVIASGAITGVLTLRPLGAIRVLRRFATPAVMVVLAYLFFELLRHPLPALGHGTWSGFWAADDTVVAAAISFAPMAADYTRHARSAQSAFLGTLVGYSATQVLCYVIGLVALVSVAHNPSDIYGSFIAVPFGALCFAILATRELDQSFANVYSTAISMQNLGPRWDRRSLAVGIAALSTVLTLWINIADYENFLDLLGSVFIPMTAVFVVDYFILSKGGWDLSTRSRRRARMLIPWAFGFIAYQLINPGYVEWWVAVWTHIGRFLHLSAPTWMSASVTSFVVAGAATFLLSGFARGIGRKTTSQTNDHHLDN